METTRRYDALREMDITTHPDGSVRLFSIGFVLKDGEYVYLPFAKKGGLRCDITRQRVRGIIPCIANGQQMPQSHPYPVSIDNILLFNGKKVIL